MKNFLYLVFSVLFIVASIYVLIPWYYKDRIPPVKYLNVNKKEVKLSDINLNNKQTYIFYISPMCEYCNEINSVLDTLPISKFNRIVICSYDKNTNYFNYKNKFKLKKEDTFLIDLKNNFIYDFNISLNYSLPLVLKYNENGIKQL